MFENVGGKLKVLAIVVVVLGIISSIVSGIILMFSEIDGAFGFGLLIIGGGILGSWITALPIYGIGQAAENSDYLVRHTIGTPRSAVTTVSPKPEKRTTLTSGLTTASTQTSASSVVKRCPHCGERVQKKLCEYCGKENDYFN